MRIIHSSDWHLGQFFYGKSRANEHKQFLSWLLAQVSAHQIDAVIVAGDIFDTGTPPSYAREMYFDFIGNMHKLGCQLVVLAGNHDSVAMLAESKPLLEHLSTRVIPVVISEINIDDEENEIKNEISSTENLTQESEQVFYLYDKDGKAKAVICAIPFIRPRDVIKSQAGQSAAQKQQSLQNAISEHYQQLFVQAQGLAKGQLPIIATGHLTTVGVTRSESVRDIYIGTLDAFPANAFPPADYIALGHIHRSQKVAKTEHIRYCGSPIPLSFDEVAQDKVVLLVEFENCKAKVTDLVVPRFQSMAMIKTGLDTLSDDVKSVLTNQQNRADNKTENLDENKIWLDIEINSAEYLHDLTERIENLVAQYPVEILLVRRSKKSRELMPSQLKKITLNELSLDDVYESRIAQENWQTTQELARKERLSELFKQAVAEATVEQKSAEQSKVGHNK